MHAPYQPELPLKVDATISSGVDEPPWIDIEFDIDFANRIAAFEAYNKHLYRPNTYLHKWWARRCGSTFRLILKHLVPDADRRHYYAPGGLEGKIILDPMMGGGTTLHEAIRLGANVIGADIDPIPTLQARATLSHIPLRELEAAFEQLFCALRADVSPYFVTSCPSCQQNAEVQFVLYGLSRACRCERVICINSTVLRYDSNGLLIRICPRCHAIPRGEVACNCLGHTAKPRLVEKETRRCQRCNTLYRDDYRTSYHARYAPLVVVSQCPEHGLCFAPPTSSDLERIADADSLRSGLGFLPDDFKIQPGPKSSDLVRQGVTSYLDLFSSRQLLYLRRAIDLLPSFDRIVRLNLALLVSTSLEFNSLLCGYKGADKRRPGAVRHTFSHHAYSIPYTALENNPVFRSRASGNLRNLFEDRIRRARCWALQPKERVIKNSTPQVITIRGEVDAGVEVTDQECLRTGVRRFLLIQGSSASLDLESNSIDYVVTDPPYFDSVQYSDLAAFFRVWLKKLAPTDAEWDYDLWESAVDPHGNGNGQYTEVLSAIYSECHRVLKKNGRLIFTYHHWSPRGWAAVTLALRRAGFVLVNRYVTHSENPVSVHIINLKALTHDAILVLAPVEAGVTRRWHPPDKVDKTNSLRFCEDCAKVLGWMLALDVEDAEVERLWRKFIE